MYTTQLFDIKNSYKLEFSTGVYEKKVIKQNEIKKKKTIEFVSFNDKHVSECLSLVLCTPTNEPHITGL